MPLPADIDECAEGLARCGHRCVNWAGSFACACRPGSELGADGKQCYSKWQQAPWKCVAPDKYSTRVIKEHDTDYLTKAKLPRMFSAGMESG